MLRPTAVAVASLSIAIGVTIPVYALHAVQPRGAAGCIDARGAEGCARAVSLSEQSSLGPIAVSRNGGFLYAVDSPLTGASDRNHGRLLIFARNRSSGALRQLPGRRGCLQNTFTRVRTQRGPCQLIGGIENAQVLTVSPDGRRLYATTAGVLGSYLVTFVLDPRSGAARRLQCLTNVAPSKCTFASFQEPNVLIVSPDSRFVYVGSLTEQASGASPLLVVYRAGPRGLVAEQCIAGAAARNLGCIVAPALGNTSVDGLAETPDARVVYAGAASTRGQERIVALAADPTSGRLAPLSAAGACVSDEPAPPPPCASVALTGHDLAIDPSGDTLYAAADVASGGPGTFAVAALARDAASGALSEAPGPSGCVVFPAAAAPACGALPGWTGAARLPVVSPRSDVLLATVHEAGGTADSVLQLARAASADALLASDVGGCEPAACPALRGIAAEGGSIASSPDGRSLYLADGPGIAQLRVAP